jgi:Family of unknown function (DUF6492)
MARRILWLEARDWGDVIAPAYPRTPEGKVQSICIITPTHARDILQFSLLRRSINSFAPLFPQLAIVNTEDYAAFRDRFAGEPNLNIVKSADVLPKSIEYRRRRSGPHWLTTLRRVPGRLIKGWHAQQLMKLNALAECPYEAAAFFDSDVFICRPIGPDYFYVGERLKLYRRRAPNAECMDFDIAAHEILGNPLEQITELYDFIFSPSCFRKCTARRLFEEFRLRRRSSWVRRFLAQKRASEYHLLGYAATVLEGGAGYAIIDCNPDDLHHSVRYDSDRVKFAAELQRINARPKDFALIQSRLKMSFNQVEAAFDAVLAAHLFPSATHGPSGGPHPVSGTSSIVR